MCRSDCPSSERGFALAIVVLLLFAIGVAGAVSFQRASTEARLALQGQETAQAYTIADAGLQRYLGSQVGGVQDSVRYQIGGGEALVTVRRVFDLGFPNRLYLVSSEGRFSDPRAPEVPARRIVRQFAVDHQAPLNTLGAVQVFADVVTSAGFTVDGRDMSTSADCPDGGSRDVAGLVSSGTVGVLAGSVGGSPATRNTGGRAALLDALDISWSVLTDPDFGVDYQGQSIDYETVSRWPDFTTIDPDSFPVTRITGSLTANGNRSGWGTLIVTGTIRLRQGFQWDGIILAGENEAQNSDQSFQVRGTFVGGLEEGEPSIQWSGSGSFRYHACNVLEAGRELAHLEPYETTWWEALY